MGTTPPFLLDTCTVLWVANGARLRKPAVRALQKPEVRLMVSPITAWEIATLVAKRKIALSMSPDMWFERFHNLPEVALAEMSPSVLIASASLPGAPPADPTDRILIATARECGYVLMTRDKRILEYGACGHVGVMAC